MTDTDTDVIDRKTLYGQNLWRVYNPKYRELESDDG